jgi:hypothetical protein
LFNDFFGVHDMGVDLGSGLLLAIPYLTLWLIAYRIGLRLKARRATA